MQMYAKKFLIILLLLIIVGASLRVYNLNWGAPYYFHPDERNIASSVTALSFPDQMNPKFFAYGSLPIYIIYFSGLYVQLLRGMFETQLPFETAIIVSRFYSASLSLLLIPLLFVIGKKLRDKTAGLLAAALGTFTVGFVQFSHFGTFEIWLTIGSVLLFYLCLLYIEKSTARLSLLIGVALGALVAVKVSSIALLPLVLLALLLSAKHHTTHAYLLLTKNAFIMGVAGVMVYFLTNPFVILDFSSFVNSMRYESGVATGTLNVFYTGEFVNATPVMYPFIKIYPFLLSPVLTLLFLPAFGYILYKLYKSRNPALLLLITCYLLLFLSQTFLYVQWTRYYVPTIPLMLLIIAFSLSSVFAKQHTTKFVAKLSYSFILAVSAVFTIAYVITAFIEPDTRVQAASWAEKNMQPDAPILSEVYDLGIVPFNEHFPRIRLFDFYSLDGTEPSPLDKTLRSAEYIILPSQRIIKPRLGNPDTYPKGYEFYRMLSDGSLGFEKVYETPCSLWCRIAYLGDSIYSYEGTASVFDRPTVSIFQRND